MVPMEQTVQQARQARMEPMVPMEQMVQQVLPAQQVPEQFAEPQQQIML